MDKILGASVFYNLTDKVTLQSGVFSELVNNKFKDFEGSGGVAGLLKLGYKVE